MTTRHVLDIKHVQCVCECICVHLCMCFCLYLWSTQVSRCLSLPQKSHTPRFTVPHSLFVSLLSRSVALLAFLALSVFPFPLSVPCRCVE